MDADHAAPHLDAGDHADVGDHVDHLLAQWAEERPELDVTGLAIVARVVRLQRFLDRRTEAAVAAHGLTIGESNVLAALRRSGPPHTLTPTKLYRGLLLSSAAMTHRLDRLQELGYVHRSRAEHDRRQVLVALTPAGREVVDAMMDDYTDHLTTLLGVLDEDERGQLERGLRALLLRLEGDEPG